MAIDLEVYKWCRIVPVRFSRAKSGDPDAKIPQPDDRSYSGAEHGPIFGILQGDTVAVRLRREALEAFTPLFVTSSDKSVFTVVDPPSDEILPMGASIDIRIKGVGGGTPKTAKLEVRYSTTLSAPFKGPVLHEATIWVWHPPLDLRVTPHLVTIQRNSGPMPRAARGTTADVDKILEVAKAIWRPCGIRLLPSSGKSFKAAAKKHTIPLATEGVVKIETVAGGEVDKILGLGNIPHTVNAYFFNRFDGEGTLGLGISPATQADWGLANNGILLADVTIVGGETRIHDVPWSGNDLAHEIGHFLTLPHVENRHGDNPRNDTWSRRCLMHPSNRLPDARQPFQTDVGYGALTLGGVQRGRRGALVTMKDLAQLTTDGECTKARGKVSAI